MPKKFDEKQKAVLDSKKENQLVSAGAGSGKTTVMIEKITSLILSNEIKISELIVLTFTNQAGAEMKQKLIKSMNEQIALQTDKKEFDRINALRNELDTAVIDTIDGFCSKMVKKYFFKLNLSPDTNIATGISQEYYIQKAMDEAIRNIEQKYPKDFQELADCFEKNARSLEALKESVLSSFNFVMAQKDYKSFLEFSKNEYRGEYASAHFLNNYIISMCEKFLKTCMYYVEDIKESKAVYGAIVEAIALLNKIDIKNSVLKNVGLLQLLPTCRFNAPKDDFAFSFGIIKNEYQKIKKLKEDFEFLSRYGVNWNNNTQHIDTFVMLLDEFITIYNNTKAKFKVMDFSDLERYMLKLLSIDEIKKDLHEQYKYIFVDEYQDINPMQDAIIGLLKSEYTKMFFVGDVKQSIYGFRQSTPEMFISKYKKYKNEEQSESFDMNINFRTAPSILNFNNEIFSELMTEEKTDIDYKLDAYFIPKREDFPIEVSDVEVACFNNEKEEKEIASGVYSVKNDAKEDAESNFSEALFVVDKIKSLVGKEFYDSAKKEYREMKFSDITILSRSINDNSMNSLIEVLKNNHIPISISNKVALQEAETVNLVINILKLIANEFDDVSLMAYLMTNLAGFSIDEVYKIVLNTTSESLIERLYEHLNLESELNIKIRYALNLLEELQNSSYVLNNTELIKLILNKYNLKYYILTTQNGVNELDSLERFLEGLSENENRLSLEDFINYLELNLLGKADYSQIDDIDAVTIQTIHASKGLEYPVVILFNASKKFRPNNFQDDVNFDNELGIGLSYFDLTKRTKWDSMPKFAIKLKNKIKCYKEELRLLYVAVTRPQNKLIITGGVSFSKLNKGNFSEDNYLELILSVFKNKIDIEKENIILKFNTITFYDKYNLKAVAGEEEKSVSVSINGKNLEFSYPFNDVTNINLKNNVTAISKEINEEYNILPKNLYLNENLNARHDSSKELGTQYHSVFSKFDFSKTEISSIDIGSLDKRLVEMAFEKLSNIQQGSIRQLKEAPFLMYIPYNEIYKDSDVTDKILVQGVIDLLIEFEDKIILIDYKLSRASSKELKERYKMQLQLYKLAIEKAYNKKVEKSLIYNIITGEII